MIRKYRPPKIPYEKVMTDKVEGLDALTITEELDRMKDYRLHDKEHYERQKLSYTGTPERFNAYYLIAFPSYLDER